MSDDFDFGFTAVDENELDAVKQANDTAQKMAVGVDATQDKIDRLYNAIPPLLNNLKKNPEKDYILWPNRLEKVEQFESMLQGIYKS